MVDHLLKVQGLQTEFRTARGVVRAVDGLDLEIAKGQTLALVGESGSGKSVTAFSLMGLIASPPGKVSGASVSFKGQDLLQLSREQLRELRGNQIAMIFQEPMTSLNPLFTVGEQIAESLRKHKKLGRAAARVEAIELLDLVGIGEPARRVDEYPHRLSGGMRQRVMIAMALACKPDLLIADEPTTALDVTVQAQIMQLLEDLRRKFGMAILLITHDLGIVAAHADRVAVMYAGRKVEEADVSDLFYRPLHPYTRGLLGSLAKWDDSGGRLAEIPGVVPSLIDLPKGCSFAARCEYAQPRCRIETPELIEIDSRSTVACFVAAANPSYI